MKNILLLSFCFLSTLQNEDCAECVQELLLTGQASFVCGDNGITFLNECFADCNDVRVEFEGRCPRNYCPRVYYPVCTASGNSYLNECEANYAQETIVLRG